MRKVTHQERINEVWYAHLAVAYGEDHADSKKRNKQKVHKDRTDLYRFYNEILKGETGRPEWLTSK